jgi:hypothetical protein
MLEAGGSLSFPSAAAASASSSPSSSSSSFQMKILGIFSHICNKQILGVSLVKFYTGNEEEKYFSNFVGPKKKKKKKEHKHFKFSL